MLGDEYGTASNIKSRVNRLSVLSAITSCQQRLKLYNRVRVCMVIMCSECCACARLHAQLAAGSRQPTRPRRSLAKTALPPHKTKKTKPKVPPNGLVVYTGTILTDDGKEKKVNIDFEPFKPINTSLYLCDNKFHTEALAELLESDNR